MLLQTDVFGASGPSLRLTDNSLVAPCSDITSGKVIKLFGAYGSLKHAILQRPRIVIANPDSQGRVLLATLTPCI